VKTVQEYGELGTSRVFSAYAFIIGVVSVSKPSKQDSGIVQEHVSVACTATAEKSSTEAMKTKEVFILLW